MTLSISAAWDETAAFARREARLLFLIAFLMLSLPAAIVRAIAPVAAAGDLPRAGLWLASLPILLCLSLIGALAISALALGQAARAGAAFRLAAGRFVVLLGAAVLIALGGALLAVPVFLLAGLIAATASAYSALPVLAALPVYLFLWVRLMLMTPAAAAQAIGPVALIKRSWKLTGGHFWRLLGFVLTVTIVSLVVLAAVGAIGGILITLAAGRPEPGNIAMLLVLIGAALIQAVISGLFTVFVARIYAQLAVPTGGASR